MKPTCRPFRVRFAARPPAVRGALLTAAIAAAGLLAGDSPVAAAGGDDRRLLGERQLQEQVQQLRSGPGALERARHPGEWLGRHWLSSQQVKALVRVVPNEDARLELAVALYPRTVDPENFYEVYDAFNSYSRVFRLHDYIRGVRPGPVPLPAPTAVVPLSEDEFRDIVRVVRAEGFDDNRKAIAKQAIAGKGRFLARQVRDLLRVFAFEETRLDLAMFAYEYTYDPENYYLVNEVFAFSDNKERLARHIELRRESLRRR
jgi:hypothetical protein